MTVNTYFQAGIPEAYSQTQDLIEQLTIEAIQIGGMNVYYVPRTILSEDINPVLTEDVLASYDNAYQIEAYLENATGFEGDGAMLSKFGIEISDSCTFVMSRARWTAEVGSKPGSRLPRPIEGDIIYLPLTKSFFEIKKVNAQNPFYQLGKLYTYRLDCELFNFSHEDFNTGVDEVDELAHEINLHDLDAGSQNEVFDTKKTDVLDFDASNPFGDIQ
jgi:hypothetical protein